MNECVCVLRCGNVLREMETLRMYHFVRAYLRERRGRGEREAYSIVYKNLRDVTERKKE